MKKVIILKHGILCARVEKASDDSDVGGGRGSLERSAPVDRIVT